MWVKTWGLFPRWHQFLGNMVAEDLAEPRLGWTWIFPTELMIRFQACKQDVKLSPAPKKQITSTSSSTSGHVDILQSTQLPARITKPLSIKDRSIPKRDTFDLFDITVDRIQFVGEFLLWYNSETEIDEQIFKWKKIPWNLTNKTKMVKKRET